MADLTQMDILDRMVRAVERVRERLLGSTRILESRGIEYAISGDHAVAAWITSVDPSAVRSTPEVELLIKRDDVDEVRQAMASHGYMERQSSLVFTDASAVNERDAIEFILASESATDCRSPSIKDRQRMASRWVLTLDAIVRINLSRFQTLNRLRLRDLIDVGLVDSAWLSRLPADLAPRLRDLLDTPAG